MITIMNLQQCQVLKKTQENHFSNLYIPEHLNPALEEKKHIFFVDSRDVPNKFGDFSYAIEIPTPYKNVKSIELKGMSFPKIADENYVILEIDECKDRVESVDGGSADRTFAVCYFDKMATGEVRPTRGADFDRKFYTFNPPLNRLGRIHVKFKKHGGSVVAASDVNGVTNHTLLFEITT